MSDFGVYDDEMLNNRFSDQDVERLLSGQMPEDEDLARLAPLLEALHGKERVSPPEEKVIWFAAQAAEIAMSTRPETRGTTTPERAATRSRRFVLAFRAKMATGLAAVLLLAGMTGLAVASNHAAPGDPLYGLDRALEAVGIGDGGAAERIAEAQTLFHEGHLAGSLEHAGEAVEVDTADAAAEADIEATTSEEAREALEAAAEKLRTNMSGSEQAIDVRTNVADLLDYMATTEDTGSAFGQEVASFAGAISDENNDVTDDGATNAETRTDNADAGADNAENAGDGLDTADQATDNAGDGLDTAQDADDGSEETEDAADNGDTAEGSADQGLDTADEKTEGTPSSRP